MSTLPPVPYNPNYDPIFEERVRRAREERLAREAETPLVDRPIGYVPPVTPVAPAGKTADVEQAAGAAKADSDAKAGALSSWTWELPGSNLPAMHGDFSAPARLPPQPAGGGIRAFRVGGRTIYTNVPGEYEGPATQTFTGGRLITRGGGEEVPYDEAIQESRQRILETPLPPKLTGFDAPIGGGDEDLRDVVRRSKGALIEDPNRVATASRVELAPDEAGYGTPGYYQSRADVLGDALRDFAIRNRMAQEQAQQQILALPPERQAELAALRKKGENPTVQALDYVLTQLARLDGQEQEVQAKIAATQDPALKRELEDGLKAIQTRKTMISETFANAMRQPAFAAAGGGAQAVAGPPEP